MKTSHTAEQIKWHLENNVMPKLNPKAIEGILETVNDFNTGKISLDDEIKKGSGVSVRDMFEDLQIEIEPETIEFGRKPTAYELKFGYGARHYKDFDVADVTKKDGKIKFRHKCPIDGLIYTRSRY